MMTIEFYRQFAQVLSQEPVVLATVTQVKGSVPREVGAKMLIRSNSQIIGTIGGGAGEGKVIRQALTVLETGEKQFVEIDLTGSFKRETQGICGGTMQVWLERWNSENGVALVNQLLDRLKTGQAVTLVTPFNSEQFPYLLSNPLALQNSLTEVLQPPPLLLIVGAGHVGEQLAKVAHLIGYEIAIQDDRIEWANAQRYPQASMILTDSIASVMSQLSHHSQLHAALVTRGYQYDLDALSALLERDPPCHYIGMIGSEKRVRQVYQAIEKTGLPRDKLRSIYAPIGLDIGALTPEEIAVSIAAEFILVKRGGTGRPLSDALRR
jgi:xanthine dehydrogenase accessory factor